MYPVALDIKSIPDQYKGLTFDLGQSAIVQECPVGGKNRREMRKEKMRRLHQFLLIAIFVFLFGSGEAMADFRSERYQPDAPAIKKQLFTKKGRHEFSPTLALSTNDAFYQIYYANLMYSYHLADWIGIGVRLSAAFPQETGLTKALKNRFEVTPDVRRPFILSSILAEARFAPIYGKLNFFSEAVVHFDLYFLVGGGLFLTYPPNVTGDPQKIPDNPDGMGFSPAGVFGFGQRYFLMKWLAIRWEFEVMLTSETFKLRGNLSRLRLNMSFNIGFSFLL